MLDRPADGTPSQADRRAAVRVAPPGPAIEPEGAGLPALLGALRRRRRALLACLLLVPLLALAAAHLLPPRYQATATVLFEPAEPGFPRDEAAAALLASQAEIVRSLPVARQVVARLGLAERPDFAPAPRAPATPEAAEIRAAEEVLRRLAVEVVPGSRVLRIGVSSGDPALAAAAANLAAELYIAGQPDAKFAALRRASAWLDARAAALRQEIARHEGEIGELRAASGIAAGDAPQAEAIARGARELAELRGAIAAAEARVAALRGGGAEAAGPARAARDEARREFDRLAAALGQTHPETRSAGGRLAAAERALGAETARAALALEGEARAARAQAAGLEASLALQEVRLARTGEAEARIAALEREAEAARAVLRAVEERIRSSLGQVAVERPDARLLSPATPPAVPAFPDPALFAVAGLALGLGLGLLLAWGLEQADGTLHGGEDVRAALGLPCLALVPMLRREAAGGRGAADYVARQPLSPFGESLRALRAALWLGAAPPRVVAVTAARPGEGKTTTAIGLARLAAMNGERVLLVDCDIRRPAVGRLFRAEGAPGLSDMLLARTPFELAVRRDALTELDVLPAGAGETHSLGLFMSEAMAALLDRARRDYDLVVLDAPPALAMADARVVARLADATVLCVKWRDTPRSVVRHSLALLAEAKARIAGAALTQVDVRAHRRAGHADSEVYHPRYSGYFRE